MVIFYKLHPRLNFWKLFSIKLSKRVYTHKEIIIFVHKTRKARENNQKD